MTLLNSFAQAALASVSDATFGKMQYFRSHGRFPNLEMPVSFNEKIQWIKAYYHDPLMKTCADKFTVRAYVEEKAGAEHLIPLIGVYEAAEDIPFLTFPERFVIKASHGSGWNLLCRDRGKFDASSASEKMSGWLETDFYKVGREWSYQGLVPRMVCEEFICGEDGEPPWDYKFFCFHGEPRYIQVDHARFSNHTRSLYDAGWVRVPCQLEYALEPKESQQPKMLGKMLEIARVLAKPFPFVRVDLYELGDQVFFGELTFYPGKGVERFSPRDYDLEFGKWLIMDEIRKAASAFQDIP